MKSKKRKLICQKTRMGKRIKVIFKGIDWALFIGFCFLAGHFMKNVIDEYQAKKTSFTQSLEPITKLPTVVLCLESDYAWVYGSEVNISYMAQNNDVSLKENQKYDLIDDNEVVEFNQFDGKCFKINSTLMEPFEQSHSREITIHITEDMPKPKYIPYSRDYYPQYYFNLGIFWVNFYLVKDAVY